MNCPHCKEESSDDKVCTNCSREIPEAGVKVQYRDFKGSEMLDIRMPSQPAPSGQEEDAFSETSDAGAGGASSKRRSLKIFLVAAVVIGSIMAWYFVLKYLLRF